MGQFLTPIQIAESEHFRVLLIGLKAVAAAGMLALLFALCVATVAAGYAKNRRKDIARREARGINRFAELDSVLRSGTDDKGAS